MSAADQLREWLGMASDRLSGVPPPSIVDRIEEDALAANPAPAGLDVEDWETIIEALQVASSYPAEMAVNRERWDLLRARLAARLPEGTER